MKCYLLLSVTCFFLLTLSGCVSPRYSRPVYRPAPVQSPGLPNQEKQNKWDSVDQSPNQNSVQQLPRPANRAVATFSRQSDRQLSQGDFNAAAQTLERGLRIAPKDALLWSKLARVRLLQHQYPQARSLATKSNSLARGNRALVQLNRQIIEQAQ